MRKVIVALALLLCGCATHAQREFEAMKSGNAANAAQIKECNTAVYNSPASAPLRPHVPLSIADATLQQLSDTSFATSDEVQAILTTHPEVQLCRKTLLTNLAHTEPSLVPILTASYNRGDDDVLALIQKKLSWGDFVLRARDRATETQAALQAADHRVVGELKEENQAEIAQRQRAADALAQWAQTQQLINAANRPVITNCNAFGNSVNCMTH